jgi:hypothetical protein
MFDKPSLIKAKATSKADFNLWLLAIAFSIFTFICALNPLLLKENAFLSLQLAATIPLLSSSIFARAKLAAYTLRPALWDVYAFGTFILAYSFLVNVVGILLSEIIDSKIALIYWGINIFAALVYSALEITEEGDFGKRIIKDAVFILIVVLAGVLPALKIF